MTTSLVLLVVGAVFVGALMRTVFGFGEAIVSMPLLALLPIPLSTAVALIGLAGLAVASVTVISGWQHIDRPVLLRLTGATIVGIPVGLLMVTYVPAKIVTGGLGIFLIAYGSYALVRPMLVPAVSHPPLNERGWVLPFGFAAGSLGSAFNLNGVPVVVYGTLRRWSPERLRSTLQAHFLVSGVLIVSGHALGGLWTADLFPLFAYSLPAILGATVLGLFIGRRISAARFENYLFFIIVALGVVLLTTP